MRTMDTLNKKNEKVHDKLKKMLNGNPMTTKEIKAKGIDSISLLGVAYNYSDIHLAPLMTHTVFFLEKDFELVVRKLMNMKNEGIISDRDLQIYNTTEELLKKYDIENEYKDWLRGKTIENYREYKRKNKKRMDTISRDKVRQIVEGSFLLSTKQLYIPAARTRSSAYKEVLSKIGGTIPSRPSFHIDGLIRKVRKELNLSENEATTLKRESEKIAKHFEDNALRYIGKNDLSLAGAYIYVALKRLRGIPEITQEKIGNMAGTTVPTIVEHVRDVRNLLEMKRITE